MNDRVIETVQTSREEIRSVRPDHWTFTPHGRLASLYRAVLRWMARHGHLSQAFNHEVKLTRHVIRPDNFMHALSVQREEVFRQLNREAKTLIIGLDDYRELMNDPCLQSYIDFPARFQVDFQLFGLTVKVVPWIRGMVVLP